MAQPATSAWWDRGRIAGLVAATIVAYANALRGPFQFDDFHAIVENPAIRDLSSFVPLLSPTAEYPLQLIKPRWVGDLSFALDYRLWGIDPRGYHLTNLFVHLAAVLLVYRLGLLLLRAPRLETTAVAAHAKEVSFWAAAGFALHPLQTQAVTYVVQRFASLATLLVLVAAVAWFEARRRWGGAETRRVVGLTVVAVLASALAMVTKEMVVTAPLLILLADFLLFAGATAKRLATWLPLGATPGLAFAGAIFGRPLLERLSAAGADTGAVMGMTHADFLLTELEVVATYLRLLVWPAGQNVFWDYPIEHSLFAPKALAALALLTGLGGGAVLATWSRRAPPELRLVSWGIAWFFGALVVESGPILIIDVINEHRVYFPSVGLFLAASVGLFTLARRVARPTAFRIAGLVLLAAWGLATSRRNAVWERGVTLWEDCAAKSPALPSPLFMVGLSWERENDWARAAEAYQRSLAVDPRYFPARLGLRAMCTKLGRSDCALHASATLAFLEGNSPQALRLWQQGLQVNPRYAAMHYGIGLVLERAGQPALAGEAFTEACRLGAHEACLALSSVARPVPGW